MSLSFYIASPRSRPTKAALATVFDSVEGNWRDGFTLDLVALVQTTTLARSPEAIRKLPAAKRKTILAVTGKAITTRGVLDALTGLLAGELFSEDGDRQTTQLAPSSNNRSDKLVIDVSVPDMLSAAFSGRFLPVVVARKPFEVALPKIASKLAREQRRDLGFSRASQFEGRLGDTKFVHVSREDRSFYAFELQQLGVTGVEDMMRFAPTTAWGCSPTRDEQAVMLALACALARLGRGVVYARPGGFKYAQPGDDVVAVAFDFASGDPVAVTPRLRP